jgi:hypothetical protein
VPLPTRHIVALNVARHASRNVPRRPRHACVLTAAAPEPPGSISAPSCLSWMVFVSSWRRFL